MQISWEVTLAPSPWGREGFGERGSDLTHTDLSAQDPSEESLLEKHLPTHASPPCISLVSLPATSPCPFQWNCGSRRGTLPHPWPHILTVSGRESFLNYPHIHQMSLPLVSALCSTFPISLLCTSAVKGPQRRDTKCPNVGDMNVALGSAKRDCGSGALFMVVIYQSWFLHSVWALK